MERNDHDAWAAPVDRLHVEVTAPGHQRGNVEGRRPTGPLQGFGQLWQKSYEVLVPDASPDVVIATWKANFGAFWPEDSRFQVPPGGIAPGEIALVGGGRGIARTSTGVRVIYADERSWAYMTPEGHPWAAIITFSASEDEQGRTRARVDLLVRANDPIFEVGFHVYSSRLEDRTWTHTLEQLAGHFGADQPAVVSNTRLVDKRRQWRNARNVWQNAAVRTLLRRDRHEPAVR